jgi:hypothetical protein
LYQEVDGIDSKKITSLMVKAVKSRKTMKFFRKPLKPAAHDLIDWNIEDPTGIQIKKDYY